MKAHFSSKANVLKILQNNLKKSKIEKIYDFTISDWDLNETKLINYIKKNFSNKIVIRSSAIGEDSIENSQAGNYESILDIPSNSVSMIKQGVEKVINSYENKENFNKNNQILVQNQSNNIITSGVVFTRTSQGSPYYVVNYSDGASTDNVTKGEINNVVKFFIKIDTKKLPKKWKVLLESVKEIELIFKNLPLDIEFGINKSYKVIIFQVRPITFVKNFLLENKLEKKINLNQKKFLKLNKPIKHFGNFTLFSDMADWNPSEIIGNNPNLLDYSLYDYLILKKMWREGRKVIGYHDTSPLNLMNKFGNKPYIDIRASFSSMLPNNLNPRLRKKLMNYYFQKLSENNELHDKVEFEILFSCFDLSTDKRLKLLLKKGFSYKEINEIKLTLIELTNNIISKFNEILENSKKNIENLESNRRIILTEKDNHNYLDLLDSSEKLLNDCRELGVFPFSTMARIAFVANILLKSLIQEKIIDFNAYYLILNNVNTPIKDLQRDLEKVRTKQLTKNQFFKNYGHLRPGTYDITADRYDKTKEILENFNFKNESFSQIKLSDRVKIQNIFRKNKIIFDSQDFFLFVKDSLSQREHLKFEFTKNLSDSLELIAKAGKELGFSRSDLSHLDIKTIFQTYKNYNKNNLKKLWHKKILKQKKLYKINSHLNLPPIIKSSKDFKMIEYYISKPNFITTKKITGDIILLEKNSIFSNLDDKIVLIENADPGYDWIFSKKPLGLITKYGGVASHMAIRCSEIGLPAAIGCGDVMYEKLLFSSKVLLDCQNLQLIILENEQHDEFIEEKKILKSLGYIK